VGTLGCSTSAQFRKRTANGGNDNGAYAANQAAATKKAAAQAVDQTITKATSQGQTALQGVLSADGQVDYPQTDATDAEHMVDMDGYYTDAKCDNDAQPTNDCSGATELFVKSADGELKLADGSNSGASGSSSSTNITTPIIAAVAAGVAILALIGAGCFIKHRRSKQAQVTKVQTYQNTTLPVQNNNVVHPNMARV
jgi:hypothetical protein